jgi:hypothetical protein
MIRFFLLISFWTMAGMLTVSAQTLRSFSIGNSLTAGMEGDALHDDLVAGSGRTWVSRSHTVPGTPLNWHWNDFLGDVRSKAGLPGGNWDALILQPFDRPLYEGRTPGSPRYPQGDAWNALNFAQEFRLSNPGVRTYVYQTFAGTPSNANGGVNFALFDYKAAWDAPYTNAFSNSNTRTRDYFGQVVEEMRSPQEPLRSNLSLNPPPADPGTLMIPFGDVLYEINERMRLGQFGAFTDVEQWYRDPVHLKFGLPQYVKAATFYATLFGEHPDALDWTVYDDPQNFGRIRTGSIEEIDGIPFFQSFGANVAQKEAMAALVNDAVWDVVNGHPYSGVTAIPEASTISLLLAGMMALWGWRSWSRNA